MNEISLPVELAEQALEELYALRGVIHWSKDEPRVNYQRDYNRLCSVISGLEIILGRHPNRKVSDER